MQINKHINMHMLDSSPPSPPPPRSHTHVHARTPSPTHTHTHTHSFTFSSRWYHSAPKRLCALRSVSQQSPQGCLRNSTNICLVEHRSFSTLKGVKSAASFLHSSFLLAINSVTLLPVQFQKVPQSFEYLCPAKLQTRCDICCACQSICPFIPTDSGVPRTVVPRKSVHGRVPFGVARSRIHLLQEVH